MFQTILNEIRWGQISAASEMKLKQRVNHKFDSGDGIPPTVLFPYRSKVEDRNKEQLQKLSGQVHTFRAVDQVKSVTYKAALEGLTVPEVLELKIGAQVMLIKNMNVEGSLVNGSRGVVIDFVNEKTEGIDKKKYDQLKGNPVIKFISGRIIPFSTEEWEIESGGVVVASRKQIPLVLAWAMSIHKRYCFKSLID